MGKVKDCVSCLGQYQPEGECLSCVLAFLCIDTTIAIDAYWDEQANRQQEIEEMEGDISWFDSTHVPPAGRS